MNEGKPTKMKRRLRESLQDWCLFQFIFLHFEIYSLLSQTSLLIHIRTQSIMLRENIQLHLYTYETSVDFSILLKRLTTHGTHAQCA